MRKFHSDRIFKDSQKFHAIRYKSFWGWSDIQWHTPHASLLGYFLLWNQTKQHSNLFPFGSRSMIFLTPPSNFSYLATARFVTSGPSLIPVTNKINGPFLMLLAWVMKFKSNTEGQPASLNSITTSTNYLGIPQCLLFHTHHFVVHVRLYYYNIVWQPFGGHVPTLFVYMYMYNKTHTMAYTVAHLSLTVTTDCRTTMLSDELSIRLVDNDQSGNTCYMWD